MARLSPVVKRGTTGGFVRTGALEIILEPDEVERLEAILEDVTDPEQWAEEAIALRNQLIEGIKRVR